MTILVINVGSKRVEVLLDQFMFPEIGQTRPKLQIRAPLFKKSKRIMFHLVLTLVSDALLNESAELLDHQVGLECSNPKVFQSFLLPDLLELADFHRLLRVILDCQKDQS